MAQACDSFRIRIGRLLDNELAGRDRRGLYEHLASCPGCTAELAAQRALRAHLRQTLADEARAVDLSNLWTRVEAGINRQPRRPSWRERVAFFWTERLAAYRTAIVASAAGTAVVAALVTSAFLQTTPANHSVSIDTIETAETDDGTSTAIISVPDGKGGKTTVIWVTEDGKNPDDG
jgi:anti-sigma factor RsiW